MMIGDPVNQYPILVRAFLASALGMIFATWSPVSFAQDDERKAGEEIVAIYLGAAPLSADQQLNRYVSLVGLRIASQTERASLDWTFGVLESASVNAFSAPGGYVLLTRGLIDMLDSEDELAAVLGHEIAHITRQHHWKIIKQQQDAAKVIAKMQGNMKQGNALFAEMNSLFSDMMTRGLDKQAEFEADRDALILAANAGYDCSAILGVLEKLEELKSKSASSSLLFQTHPSPSQRIDEVVMTFTPDLESCAVPSPAADRLSRFAQNASG